MPASPGGTDEQPFDDKNPSPGCEATAVSNCTHSPGQETTKSTGKRRRRVKNADPQAKLGSRVDCRQIENHAREQSAFCQTQESTQTDELVKVAYEPENKTKETPQECHERDPDPGRDLLENQVAGDLGSDVEGIEDDQTLLILEGCQAEFLVHAVDLCVANIGAVEERAENEEDEDGEDSGQKTRCQYQFQKSGRTRRLTWYLAFGAMPW